MEPDPVSPDTKPARPRLSVIGLAGAAGFLVCLFTLTGFGGRLGWLLEITSHFRVQYAVILGALALLFVWRRKHRTSAVFLVFAILNGWLVSPFLIGASTSAPSSSPHLRLLSWNVNSANRKFDELPRLLNRYQPDVVLLMEVDTEWAAFLRSAMTKYPHQLVDERDDNFGIALFSKVPLGDPQTLNLGPTGLPSVTAALPIGDQFVRFIGTHPLPPAGSLRTEYRDDQLNRVAVWVREQTNQVVLAGDLNMTPWSPAFDDLLSISGLHNSSDGHGVNGSWPAFFPPMLIPIDHFLTTKDVTVLHREIVKATGSDHLPQVVDFGLR